LITLAGRYEARLPDAQDVAIGAAGGKASLCRLCKLPACKFALMRETPMQGPVGGDIATALMFFRTGNAAQAARCCKAILRRNGNDVAALYLLALSAMQQQDYAEAERIFAKVIRLKANSAEIWTNRGNNLIALGKPDRALDAFERALAIEPMYLEA